MGRRACLVLVLSACHSLAASPALDEYLRRMEAAGFSGAVLVSVRGKVILSRGYGWADAGGGVPNASTTRFVVASISKTVTAAAIAKLKADGRLDWDDPIGHFFPEAPSDKRGITIAQLLTHSSGLAEGDRGEAVADREAALRAILAPPLGSTEWRYSNDGYALLAAIVETVSGSTFELFVHRELLAPAGMASSAFFWEKRQPAGVAAHGYNGDLDAGDPLQRPPIGWGRRGAGGLVTTVGDLHRWVRFLDAAIPPSVQAEMLARTVAVRPGLRAGMGWFVLTTARGTRLLYHGGNDTPAGYTAELRRYVDEDIVTVLTSNAMVDDVGYVGLRSTVGACVEAILFGGRCDMPPPVAPRPVDAGLAGIYRLPSGGRLRVEMVAGGLAIGADGQDAVDLLRPGSDEERAARLAASARAETAFGGRALGTAPVGEGLTTFVQRDAEIVRVVWAGTDVADVLLGRQWAATTRLVPQAGGAFIAYAPLSGTGVRVRVEGDTLRIGDVAARRMR